jgi:hypothetical protein
MKTTVKNHLKKLEDAIKDINIPSTIKYVCLCKASIILRNRELEKPSFLQSESMLRINIYLMPEIAAGFSNREILNKICKQIENKLGKHYTVVVCPTKNTMLKSDGYYLNIN